MLKIALTGNIGSGKSVVAKVFSVIGIPVFNADLEAKKLYSQKAVVDELIDIFGIQIINSSGEIDKKKLANIIFNDSNLLSKINKLIHPLVNQEFNNWCEVNSEYPYIIHETAILFENNLQDKFDFVIVVSANLNLRIDRVMRRDNVEKQAVIDRIANQLPDEEKCRMADFIIYNNEDDMIISQVLEIHSKLIS